MPINNPIPLIADNNMYAKFEKIPWINTQVIDRKWWARTDGRTDGRTDTEGYNIIPRHTLAAGYKNQEKQGPVSLLIYFQMDTQYKNFKYPI